MKLKVNRINSVEFTMFANHVALLISIDECDANEVLSELWELYGDEWLFERLRREGYAVIPDPGVAGALEARLTFAGAVMDRLTPEERKQVMDAYCRGCGDKRPNCPCERDE